MKILPAFIVVFAFAGNSNAAPGHVDLIGYFSNMKATGDEDPHMESGYSVRLYRQDETLFGSIAAATGSLEPAQGRLYDIEFNSATGQLRFKAKYSSGWEHSKQIGPGGRQKRELIIFSGTVTRRSLTGRVVLKDGYQLTDAGKATRVLMKRNREAYKPKSLEEWATHSFLDPKW